MTLMKRLLSLSFFLLVLCRGGAAYQHTPRPDVSQISGNAPAEVKEQILEVDERHGKAIDAKDRAALESILADGWSYFNERGEVLTRDQWISNIEHRKLSFDKVVHDQIRMDIFGDTVTVMGRSLSTLHYQGKVSRGPRRFLLVFKKIDGDWKIIAHYVSLVPAD